MKGIDVRSLAVGLLLGSVMPLGNTKHQDEPLDEKQRARAVVEVRTIELPAGSEDATRFSKRVKSELLVHAVLDRVSLRVAQGAFIIEWSKAGEAHEQEKVRGAVLDSVFSLMSEFQSYLVIETLPLPALHNDLGEWERASLRESQALRGFLFDRESKDLSALETSGRIQIALPDPVQTKETRFRLKLFGSRPPSVRE